MPRPEVVTATPTLFGADGALDPAADRALHERLHGVVDGVFVAGTTGEFPALSDAERLTLFRIALEVWGPGPVIGHVGAPATSQAVGLTRAAVGVGVTRVAALPPYYFAVDARDVVAHYEAIRAAAGTAAVYAYLFPERTGVAVAPGLLADLVTRGLVDGAKISGSAADAVADVVAALPPGTPVWSGADAQLAAAAAAGARGVVSGLSAADPEGVVALAAAVADGDVAATAVGQARLDALTATLRSSPTGIKAALVHLGFGAGVSRMMQGAGAVIDLEAVAALFPAA